MLSRTIKPLACSLVAAMLGLCNLAHAGLVTNGGFETGNFDGWTPNISALYDGVDSLEVHDGTYSAYFGGPRSSISQTLTTVVGASYKVSFWLQLDPDDAGKSAPNAFSFDFGSSTGTSLSNLDAFPYQLFESTFVATDTSTDLVFRFSNDKGFWDLDAVDVTDVPNRVPEPGSLALLAVAGLGGMAAARRRRVADASA